MRSFLGVGLVLTLLGAGCAPLGPVMVDGQMVPRVQAQFVGSPYSVRQLDAHPKPGSPSSGLRVEGGRITGVVCGADIEYRVEHAGDKVVLSGIIDNRFNARVEIKETLGFHTITGSIAYREVGLQLFGDRLKGFVGRCPVDLKAEGDTLTQTVYYQNRTVGNEMHLRINGLKELWAMPPAVQAATLPLVTACLIEKCFENMGRQNPPEMTFGGPLGAQPPNTLAFGTRNNRDCGGQVLPAN